MARTHFELSKWTGPELEDVWALCGQANAYKTLNWDEVTCKRCLKKRNAQ